MPAQARTDEQELSVEDFAVGLGEDAPQRELSLEDFAKGIEGGVPEEPSLLGAAGGSFLEGLSAIPGLAAKLIDYMGATEPSSRGGMRPVQGPSGQYAQGPQIGQQAFGPAEAMLRGGAQSVYPEEQRGRGGFPEQIAGGLGSVGAGAIGSALGGPAAIITFGAQQGLPLYYDVLEATGDKEAAMAGLVFGAGVGQLERFGAEKYAGNILKKLAKGKLGEATKTWATHAAMGALGEAGTEAAQQALTDAAQEELTGEDLDNWERIKQVVPPALLLGGFFGGLDAAIHGRPEASTAIQRPSEAVQAPSEAVHDKTPEKQAAEGKPTPEEVAWAKRFLAKPETKEPPLGVPDLEQESLQAAVEAERAAGKHGPIRTKEEVNTRKRWPIAAKESLRTPLNIPNVKTIEERIDSVGRDHGVSADERGKAFRKIERGFTEAVNSIRNADAVNERMVEIHDSIIEDWQKRGLIPKQIEEVVLHTPTPVEQKIDYESQIDTIGKVLGVPDAEIEGARKAMRAAPAELGLDDEFVRIVTDLRRKHGQKTSGAVIKPGEEPLLAPGLEERNKRVSEPNAAQAKAPAPTQTQGGPKAPAELQPGAEAPATTTSEEAQGAQEKPTEAPKPDQELEQLYGGIPSPFKDLPKGSEVKSAIRRQFVSGAPEEASLLNEKAAGEVAAEAEKQRLVSRRIRRAMRAEWGRKAAEGAEAKALVQEALTNPEALQKLPERIRGPVAEARAQADALARKMVSEGMVSTPMAKTIEKNQGRYLRRQYQAHADPDWAQKVPKDVRNRLKSLFTSWSAELTPEMEAKLSSRAQDKNLPTMKRREAEFELGARRGLQGKTEQDIDAEMSAMLQDAKAIAENPWAALAGSKVKRKDLSLFKARKGMPQEMRDFLGEVKDPLHNYTTTILKQAQFVAAHRKFKAMRESGIGKYLFEKPTVKNGVEYTSEISAGDNPSLEPLLQGKPLYTSEDINKALFKSQPASTGKLLHWAMVTNAFLKTAKVVWSPVTIAKQIPQNAATAMRAGHMLAWPKYAKKALRALSGKDEAELLNLVKLGLVNESVAAVEARDVKMSLRGRVVSKPYEGLIHANTAIGGLFQYPDAFAKVVGFYAEKKSLTDLGISDAAAARHAANIIRNLYPTASRLVPIVEKWRKQPIFGTFMAYNSEKIRTTVELYKLIRSELNSSSPKLRERARQRIAWAVAGTVATPAAALAWNMLHGVDADEDKDRRELVPPWDAERDLVWGDGWYTDLSDIDSNAWTTDSIQRLVRGDDISSITYEAFKENVAPFVDLSMFSKFVGSLALGKELRTFTSKDRPQVEAIDRSRAEILFRAVRPGVLGAFEMRDGKIQPKADAKLWPLGLSGVVPQSFEPEKSLGFEVNNFMDDLQRAGDDDGKRKAAFTRLHEKASAAIRLGIPIGDVKKALDQRLGKETIETIISGGYLPKRKRQNP